MVQCCVKSCKNRSDCQGWKKRSSSTNNVQNSFHSFPKNPTIRKMWLDILGVNSSCVLTAARICSIHFEEECFDRRGLITRLKPNALPSRLLTVKPLFFNSAVAKQLSIKDESSDKTALQKVDHSLISVLPMKNVIKEPLSPIANISLLLPSTSKVDKSTMVSLDDFSKLSEKFSTSKVDKETMVSPTLIYNCPEKSRLRKRIKFLEVEHAKKIRIVQQRARRYKNQVVTLKSALKMLKNN